MSNKKSTNFFLFVLDLNKYYASVKNRCKCCHNWIDFSNFICQREITDFKKCAIKKLDYLTYESGTADIMKIKSHVESSLTIFV
jgi:hypothetical protein